MYSTLMVTEGVKANPLTDHAIELTENNEVKCLITFHSSAEMEEIADNLLNMAQALRNKEFNMIHERSLK